MFSYEKQKEKHWTSFRSIARWFCKGSVSLNTSDYSCGRMVGCPNLLYFLLFSLWPSLSLSFSLSHSLPLSLFLTHSLSHSLSFFLNLSLTHFLSLSLSFSLSFTLSGPSVSLWHWLNMIRKLDTRTYSRTYARRGRERDCEMFFDSSVLLCVCTYVRSSL